MKKILRVLILVLVSLMFAIPLIWYRFPISKPHLVTSEIMYRMIDLGWYFEPRHRFESFMGNSRVFLVNNEFPSVFIDNNSRGKLWAYSPWVMKKKNYTVVATFKVWRVLSGDYCARLLDTIHVAHEPTIRK